MIKASLAVVAALNFLYASLAAFMMWDFLMMGGKLIETPQLASMAVALATLYLLPLGVAVLRNHHNTLAIAALNLLLGWSLLGWIAALVWALTAVRPASETRLSTAH